MNKKTKALALLPIVAIAVVIGGFLLTTQAAATTVTGDVNDDSPFEWINGNNSAEWMHGGMGRRRGPCPGGMRGGFAPFGPIEVSSEYESNVTNIAKNDSDVQALLNDGYNITKVRPIIKTIVEADGDVVTKATSAIVMLEKDTKGWASVWVDLEQGKVTRIEIVTRTVIEKP